MRALHNYSNRLTGLVTSRDLQVIRLRKPVSRRRPDESREPDIIKILDSPVSRTGQALRRASLEYNPAHAERNDIMVGFIGYAKLS
jgi:hypothetical protein